jgi:hypothetical protein
LDETKEELEARRDRYKKLFFNISMVFLISIVLTISFYTIKLELNREIALCIAAAGGTLVLLGLIIFKFGRDEGLFITMTGLCIAFTIMSLGPGGAAPITGGLLMGFFLFFALYWSIKTRYFEKIEESLYDNMKGAWEIDERGYIRKIDWPREWPEPSTIKKNYYELSIIQTSLFRSKNEIDYMGIGIIKFYKRNKEYERKLIPFIKSIIEMEFDHETIEKNGGLDQIISKINWEEIQKP